MVIVISDPNFVANEAALINHLFDEGLSLFHLRKPEGKEKDVLFLLQKINPVYYPKLALHQHFQLADEFGIHRLHMNETYRKQLTESKLTGIADKMLLSTSTHKMEDYSRLSDRFAYAFLGPVFNSISKTGYKALEETERVIPLQKKQTKLVALGGINTVNCKLPLDWGFDGIALLGALWKEPQYLIKNFKTIQSACLMIDQ